MPSITVPDEVRSGLQRLAAISDEIRGKALEFLRRQTASLSPSQLSEALAVEVREIDPATAKAVVDLLMSLELARAAVTVPVSDLVASAVEASLREDAESKARVSVWLEKALGIECLMISAKAVSLLQDNARTFLTARIMTEIRPVFTEALTDKPERPPSAALITQTLKIGFSEGGRYKEFFVTLDNDDLGRLRQTIERAEAKAETLSEFLRLSKINYLNSKGKS